MKKMLSVLVIIAMLATTFAVFAPVVSESLVEETSEDAAQEGASRYSIDSDRTWTSANSPYYINGYLYIDDGATLTIEAGVDVVIQGYQYIYVGGTLIVNGTSMNPVHFKTSSSENSYNRWGGIYVNTTGRVYFNYANVSCCRYGLRFYNGGWGEVYNSVFYMNQYGVYAYNTHTGLKFEWCTFNTQISYSVYLQYSFHVRVNNSVFNRASPYYGYSRWPYVWDCDYFIFYNNLLYGLSNSQSWYYNEYCQIMNNTVKGCDYGFYFYGRWYTVTGNQMSNIRYQYRFWINPTTNSEYNMYTWSDNYYNGREAKFMRDQNGVVINGEDLASIYLYNCDNMQILNTAFTDGDSITPVYSDFLTIDGCTVSNMYRGIYMYYSYDCTINSTDIYDTQNYDALETYYAHRLIISNVYLQDNNRGMNIRYSEQTQILNVDIYNSNGRNFYFEGSSFNQFDTSITNSFIDGQPIISYNGIADMTVSGIIGAYLYLFDCFNVTFTGNNLVDAEGGIIAYTTQCTFSNNDFRGFTDRIYTYEMNDNVFSNNQFCSRSSWTMYLRYSDNNMFNDNQFLRYQNAYSYGVYAQYSNYNIWQNNRFSTYYTSIQFEYCDYNEFYYNEFYNSQYGIYFYRCDYFIIDQNSFNSNYDYGIYVRYQEWPGEITRNTFLSCQDAGIYFYYFYSNCYMTVANNTFYENTSRYDYGIYTNYNMYNVLIQENTFNGFDRGLYMVSSHYNTKVLYNGFIDCQTNIYDNSGSDVVFDDGTLGNYYSDYIDVDTEPNGIWDNPYVISGTWQDNYPSVWELPDRQPPVVEMVHPTTGYINNNDEIQFSVGDATLREVTYKIDDGVVAPFYAPYAIPTFGWADGVYNINVVANDKYSQVTNKNFKVTVDSTLPTIKLIAPVTTEIPAGTEIKFDIKDDNMGEASYSLNNGESKTLGKPYTIKTDDWVTGSSYKVSVKAEDLAGNSLTKTFVFTIVDSNKPVVALTYPAVDALLGPNDYIQFSITDETLKNASVKFHGPWLDFLAPYRVDTNTLPNGPITIWVYAQDSYGNSVVESFTFKIDKMPPKVDLVSPENGALLADGDEIKFDIRDANLDTVTYKVNGVQKAMPNGNIIKADNWTDGENKVVVTAVDGVGLTTTREYNFVFDKTAPRVVSTNPPADATVMAVNVIAVVFSEDMDKGSVEAATSMTGLSLTYTWSGRKLIVRFPGELEDGVYSLVISSSAADLAGNPMASFALDFTISQEAPPVVITGPDADEDGMPDEWEREHGLDITTDDSGDDPDGDGLTNYEEFVSGTDPQKADTDGDGIPDKWELDNGLDPTDATDGAEDRDGDGFPNNEEYLAGYDMDDAGDHPPVAKKASTMSWLPIIMFIIVIILVIILAAMIFVRTSKTPTLDWAPPPPEPVVAPAADIEDEDELPPPPEEEEEPDVESEDEDDLLPPPEDDEKPEVLEPELVDAELIGPEGDAPEQLKPSGISLLPPHQEGEAPEPEEEEDVDEEPEPPKPEDAKGSELRSWDID